MHPAQKYIRDVVKGRINVSYEVRSAYERHEADLKRCKEKGWVFNPNYAQKVIKLFGKLRHYKGTYAGKPLQLEPWQQAIIWVVYGWRLGSADGPRRFKNIYLEIPKKNGKTTMLAGVGVYHFAFDNEGGAEVYTAATKRDQAKICFNDIKALIEGNYELKREFGIHTNTIFWKARHNKIEPLSKETNTQDGFNPSAAIVDELHRHVDDSMVNLISNSMGTRAQPIVWEITTAGTSKQSVCYKHRQYTQSVNRGKFDDPSWFGLIYTIDKDDDWRDPKVWEKANPNLGTGKSHEDMADLVQKAKNDPSRENDLKRYHFNIWGGAEEKWITDERWDSGVTDRTDEELISEEVTCYAGLDLAAVSDFNALTLTFVNEAEDWIHQKYWFWCPADTIDQRTEKQNIDFWQWVDKGYLVQIPGNVVDTQTISDSIAAICLQYRVFSLAYDRRYALHGTVQSLIDAGIDCEEQNQSIQHMSYPTKELEKLLMSGKLTHQDNPVMAWMMGNVLVYRDANDNMKLHKGKSSDKIDGPVSAVMSLARYLHVTMGENDYSPYNDKGFFS